jgi:hypothetical protein
MVPGGCDSLCAWLLKCACRRCDEGLFHCLIAAKCNTSRNPTKCELVRVGLILALANAVIRPCFR